MVNLPEISIDENYSMCFGCGQDNPIGLKLIFDWDGKTARAEFTPTKLYQGWPDIVHGGILMALLDEAMGNAVRFKGMTCVTAKIQARLKRPAAVGELLIVTAEVTGKNRRTVETKAEITLADGTLVAEGTATNFIVNVDSVSGKGNKAVVWDMDGVIANTAPYHLKAWQHVFRKRGASFTEPEFRRKFGQRNDTIIKAALGSDLTVKEVDGIADEKEKYFRQLISQNIKPLPGAVDLLVSLREHGFSLALASSAPTENIQLVLKGLGIVSYFDAIVWGREVAEGKPSPQGFLLAAKKLRVAPKNCVVIEDAVAGVAVAKRAGMRCIAVTNTNPGEALAEADLIVDTLEKVRVSDLERLLNISRVVIENISAGDKGV